MNGIHPNSSEGPDHLTPSCIRRTATDEDYEAAIHARSAIDMAVGITMGKKDCTRQTALAALRRTASQYNITILELANALRSTNRA